MRSIVCRIVWDNSRITQTTLPAVTYAHAETALVPPQGVAFKDALVPRRGFSRRTGGDRTCKSATAVQNSAARLTLAAIYDFKVNPNSLDKVFLIFLSLGDTDLGLCEELLGNSLMSSKDCLCVVLFRIGNLLNFVGLIFVELLRLKIGCTLARFTNRHILDLARKTGLF